MPILPEWWDKQLELLEAQRGFHESVLRDMVRQLNKTDFTITDTVAWENEKLQQAGMLEEDILKYISEATDKEKEEIREQFKAAKSEVFNYDNEELTAAGYEPEEFRHMSPEMIKTMNAAMKKTFTEAVNLTRTTAVTSQSAFIHAADVAHQQVISGAWSYQKAIRYAVKTTVAAQGAKVIYPSGASAKIDVAYRRTVLTGVNQTVAKLQEMRAEECENDLMETTAHYGARVEHAEWQGQVVSLSGAKGYLSKEDVGYGEVTGIFGANCRHNWHLFFEGISKPAYTPEQLEEFKNAKVSYDGESMPVDKAVSKQRTMERSIRQTKEELVCLDECIKNCTDKFEKEKAQLEFDKKCVKLKQREYRLKDFCNQTGLQLDNFRVQVFAAETENGFKGFGRSVSSKAVFAAKKELTKYDNIKYNKDGTIVVTDVVKHIKPIFKPNAVVDIQNSRGYIERTIYDNDGKMIKQIHPTNHGKPKAHPYGKNGEHANDIIWKDDKIVDRPHRDLTDIERKEHADIL